MPALAPDLGTRHRSSPDSVGTWAAGSEGLSSAESRQPASFRQVWQEPSLDRPRGCGSSWPQRGCRGGLEGQEQLCFPIKRHFDTLVSDRVCEMGSLSRASLAVAASGRGFLGEPVPATSRGVEKWAGACVGAGRGGLLVAPSSPPPHPCRPLIRAPTRASTRAPDSSGAPGHMRPPGPIGVSPVRRPPPAREPQSPPPLPLASRTAAAATAAAA